jgi:hypothetical protein
VYDPTAVMLPIERYTVTPRGGFHAERDGGVVHLGLDMSTRYQERPWNVVAPERCTVRYVDRDASSDASPLLRYGPGSILVEGALGFSHVLAHLDPSSIPEGIVPGAVLECGQFVGRVADGPNHLHWEVRTKLLSAPGAERARYTWHPLRWLAWRRALAGAAAGLALAKVPILAAVAAVASLASRVTRGSR